MEVYVAKRKNKFRQNLFQLQHKINGSDIDAAISAFIKTRRLCNHSKRQIYQDKDIS